MGRAFYGHARRTRAIQARLQSKVLYDVTSKVRTTAVTRAELVRGEDVSV